MSSVKYEFPNPVLAEGLDDYKGGCEFSCVIAGKVTIDSADIVIPVSYVLKCSSLEKLVAEGKAAVVVSVISPAVSSSRIEKFDCGKTEMVIKIPKFSVVTRIDLKGFIIAEETISGFSGEGDLNELYFSDVTFEMRKGDILGFTKRITQYLDQSELEKSVASVFTICCENDEEPQKYNVIPCFTGDKITITLKKELYELYYRFKDINGGQLRKYVTSVIVYPVLVEAVGYIIGYYQERRDPNYRGGDPMGEDYNGTRWFRNILTKMNGLELDPGSPAETPATIADALLGGISLNALRDLNVTLGAEADSGDTEETGGRD